jgi:hypothetical protein
MRRGLLIMGSLAAAVSPAVGGDARAQAGPGDRVDRFTLVAPDTEQTTVDAGRSGPSQGDLFVFSGPLRDARGRDRGRLDGHCVTVSVPSRTDREQDRRQCFVTSTIGTANGETEIQAAGVGRVLAEDVLLSVTGGTGRFRRARGQALLDYSVEGRTTVTYEVILQP